jgi:uncharacterized protein
MDSGESRISVFLESRMADGICLAFSGGVDSALLLHYLAKLRIPGKPLLAVTFEMPLYPHEEYEQARSLAALYGVPHATVADNVLQDEVMLFNPPDRCYRCKKRSFSHLRELAFRKNIRWILDGTHVDDLNEYRPGIRALKELDICSPWAELGINKAEIRQLAHKVQLPVASRPSSPCMATRFPYGARLDADVIQKLYAGETFIKEKINIPVVRLRYYDGLVRIEIMPEYFEWFLNCKKEITIALKELGFQHITLDLEGFRSGSMDVVKMPAA